MLASHVYGSAHSEATHGVGIGIGEDMDKALGCGVGYQHLKFR